MFEKKNINLSSIGDSCARSHNATTSAIELKDLEKEIDILLTDSNDTPNECLKPELLVEVLS